MSVTSLTTTTIHHHPLTPSLVIGEKKYARRRLNITIPIIYNSKSFYYYFKTATLRAAFVRFFLKHLSAPNNSHVALRSPTLRTALLIDKFHRAFASYDASKYDVFAVQMRLRIHRDVKLIPVRVRTTVSHGEYIRLLVVSTVYVLVVEFRTVYAPAFRRAGLIHKSSDDSVKFRAFVRRRRRAHIVILLKITIRYQSPKVLARFWVRVVEQFEHDSIRI